MKGEEARSPTVAATPVHKSGFKILFLTSIWAIDIFCPLIKAYSCMNFDVDI